MSEKRLVIDQLKLTFDGPFDLPGLYKLIDNFFYERNWDKFEKLNTEQVLPTGRNIKIELVNWKSITDYYKITMRIRLYSKDLIHTSIEHDGKTVELNKGKVMLVIDGYVDADRHGKWEGSPFNWFLREIFDKYIFKGHFGKAEQWLVSDVNDLYGQIQTYLNVYHYKTDKVVTPWELP